MVVLAGSDDGRPCLIKLTNWASFRPLAKALEVRSLPRPVTPLACGPWHAAQVPENAVCPFATSPWTGALAPDAALLAAGVALMLAGAPALATARVTGDAARL